MNVVQNYFQVAENLYAYFGIPEDLGFYAFEDRRAFNWQIGVGNVHFGYGDLHDSFNEEKYYSPIIKEEKIGQSIFKTECHTAILTHYNLEGTNVWAIFDNKKQWVSI